MDHTKIDAPLAAALAAVAGRDEPAEPCLIVFIYTAGPPRPAQRRALEALGVTGFDDRRRLFTATLTPDQIDALSERDWVRALRLSRVLAPRPAEDHGDEHDTPIGQ